MVLFHLFKATRRNRDCNDLNFTSFFFSRNSGSRQFLHSEDLGEYSQHTEQSRKLWFSRAIPFTCSTKFISLCEAEYFCLSKTLRTHLKETTEYLFIVHKINSIIILWTNQLWYIYPKQIHFSNHIKFQHIQYTFWW